MASEYGRVMTNRATLVGLPVEDDLGLAEVDLGLAGRVGQRDEDLGVTGACQAATASLTTVRPPV